MNEKLEPGAPLVSKINIPDSDVSGWMKALLESGFNMEEVESMLIGANDKYALLRLKVYLQDEMKIMEEMAKQKFGQPPTEEQKKALAELILARLRKIKLSDLERGVRGR